MTLMTPQKKKDANTVCETLTSHCRSKQHVKMLLISLTMLLL